MSLADLLSFGRKEAPKEEPERKPPQQDEELLKAALLKATGTTAVPKINQEELELLREQVGKQSVELGKEKAKEELQQQAARKRALDDAAEQVAGLAKQMKADNKVVDPGFHKTTLCKFFLQTRCEKGEWCPFAHNLESLVTATTTNESRMTRAKKKLCFFYENGACSNGDYCSYAHGAEDIGPQFGGGAGMPQSAYMGDGSDWPGEWNGMSQSAYMGNGSDWPGGGSGSSPANVGYAAGPGWGNGGCSGSSSANAGYAAGDFGKGGPDDQSLGQMSWKGGSGAGDQGLGQMGWGRGSEDQSVGQMGWKGDSGWS